MNTHTTYLGQKGSNSYRSGFVLSIISVELFRRIGRIQLHVPIAYGPQLVQLFVED